MPRTVYAKAEGERFAGDASMTVVSCATCFMTYAIPSSLYNAAKHWRGDRSDGCGWKLFCPLGHEWWYVGETEEERLRRILTDARDHAGRLASERDQLRASERAQRGAATRARNERDRLRARVAEGVCPCCNRTFKGLQSHMRQKHPDWVAEHGASAFAKQAESRA
jgi:hypothetical protein